MFKKNRAYKAVMHFNKPGSKSATPWTIHYRGVCHLVSKIECHVAVTSEWKPNKKSNPRAFFTAQVASLVIRDDVAYLR